MDPLNNNLPIIVGVKFSKIGKSYYFDATNIKNFKIGDFVIVETTRGWQIGELNEIINDQKTKNNLSYKPISRLATPEDLIKKDDLVKKSEKALVLCQNEVKRLNIKNIKIITSEISFDEKIISFIYTCTTDESPNLNGLKNSINKLYPNMRIDYHKIGPRDVARYLGGMGACGFTCRCCAKFIKNFESISINMAKKQGISLTPSDITGMCDRLRCCLQYEYCHYVEALNNLPKKNKIVDTPKGRGKVVDVAPLTNSVFVFLEEIGVKEFSVDEITSAFIPSTNQAEQPAQVNKDNINRRKFHTKTRKP